MGALENQEAGPGGGIRPIDARTRMICAQPFPAATFAGCRFDCSSKTGYVEATLTLRTNARTWVPR